MRVETSYFFSGIGGSGMLPLALIMRARGHAVAGSDRALDQGLTAGKFAFLEAQGIILHPQDGSGLTSSAQVLVTSAAVEDTVPDVLKARALGCREMRRAALLSSLFNAAETSIGVAGTSGKSTTTAMIAWILSSLDRRPTVINGAVMKNFVTPHAPIASAVVGRPDLFVAEVDESDGSISQYDASVAVVNNIAEDHKSMDELRSLFSAFAARSGRVVLNLDNAESKALSEDLPRDRWIGFSLLHPEADCFGFELSLLPDGCAFKTRLKDETAAVRLSAPGAHNAANALAAIAATAALGVPLGQAARALDSFSGVKRRLEIVGAAGGVTVIDDFAHNPDKITATLATLKASKGRLLVFFQPHGYGPLRLMRSGFVSAFGNSLGPDDMLLLPDPVYHGGTTDMSFGSEGLVADLAAIGAPAHYCSTRQAAQKTLLDAARAGDRIVVMGARDDTLTDFARDLLQGVSERERRQGESVP